MSNVQKKSEVALSPAVQQAIGKLNLRVTDMMEQFNIVLKAVLDENQALQAKIVELQAPVKEKQK